MRGKPGQIKVEGDEIRGDGQNTANENVEFRDGILTRAAEGWGVGSTEAFYLGNRTVDGCWRIVRSSNSLLFQRRESGAWVEKGAFTT